MRGPKPPFLLTPTQTRRLSPNVPPSHAVFRVDDRHVLSGILDVILNGLRRRAARRRRLSDLVPRQQHR